MLEPINNVGRFHFRVGWSLQKQIILTTRQREHFGGLGDSDSVSGITL